LCIRKAWNDKILKNRVVRGGFIGEGKIGYEAAGFCLNGSSVYGYIT